MKPNVRKLLQMLDERQAEVVADPDVEALGAFAARDHRAAGRD